MIVYDCKRRLLSSDPLVEDTLPPVEGSRWDTDESARFRILASTGDLPVSVRWVTSRSLFYSLRQTVLHYPGMDLVSLYNRVSAFQFPETVVVEPWTPEAFLFVFLDARNVFRASGQDVLDITRAVREWLPTVMTGQESINDILSDIHQWYRSRNGVYRGSFEKGFEKIRHLPLLDRTINEAGSEWAPILDSVRDDMKQEISFAYEYRVTPDIFDGVITPSVLFQKISVSAWRSVGLSLVVCFDRDVEPRIQISSGRMPFPVQYDFPPEFFPWDDDATDNLQGVWVYHSELGWASLDVRESPVVCLSIITQGDKIHKDYKDHKDPASLLDAWEGMLHEIFPRGQRRVRDLGSVFRMSIKNIPPDRFSWLVLFDKIVNDPVLTCFLGFSPVSLTYQLPAAGKASKIVVPQALQMRWSSYAARLWGIDESMSRSENTKGTREADFRIGAFIRTHSAETTFEIHVDMISPVPESSVPLIASFLRQMVVYTAITQDSTMDAFRDLVAPTMFHEQHEIFMENLVKHYELVEETDLTKIFPRIFVTPYYKSVCQFPLQPRLATEEQAMALGEDKNRRLLFPPEPMYDTQPSWYICPSDRFPYPGLKNNNLDDALFPLVPCCFEKPQHEKNKDKLLKMKLGVDIVSNKRKENIIQKHHIIRNAGQLGVIPEALSSFVVTQYPTDQVYRIGMNWTPFSFLECLHYVQVGGSSMPITEWYPPHLINLLYQHAGLVSGCIPFHTVDDIIRQIREASKSFWVDPRIYLPFLEQVYGVRIFVWAEEPSEKQSFILLRSNRNVVSTNPSKCVFILQHWGGRMDRLTGKSYPQCELLGWMPLLDTAAPQDEINLLFRTPRILRDISKKERFPSLQPLKNLFVSQALFPTGSIMALRTGQLTLWIGEPCTSLDIPLLDENVFTTAIARMPSTQALRQEFVQLCQDISADVHDTIYRYCIRRDDNDDTRKNKYVLIWRLRVGDFTAFTITQDMPKHGLNEIIPRARVISTEEPPHVILSYVLYVLSSSRLPENEPKHDDVLSPAMMMQHVSIMFMIRDVVFYRFLQWYHTEGSRIMPMVSLDEKIDSFLRSATTIRPQYYLGNSFPSAIPTTYESAERLCVVQDRVVLPSDATRSRLFYFLQWKIIYELPAISDPLQLPRKDQVRPNAFTNGNQLYNQDRRVVTFSLRDFTNIFSTKHFENTADTTPLSQEDNPPPFLTDLKYPSPTYVVHALPINQIIEFLEEECPPWRGDIAVKDVFRVPESVHVIDAFAPHPFDSLPYCFIHTPGRSWSLYRHDPMQTRGAPILLVLPQDTIERVGDSSTSVMCMLIVHPSFAL